MNFDQIEGKWENLKGQLKEQWGKLTDDDFLQIKGQQDQLAGKIQERYGYTREKAEEAIKEWKARQCNKK